MSHKPLLRFLFCGLLFSPASLIASQSHGGLPQKTKAGEVPASANLTSAVESQFSAFWADKFSRFNKSLLEVLNSDE